MNRSEPLALTLKQVSPTRTTYQFSSTAYFPADGQLMSQQTGSPPHDFHFTTKFHATFTSRHESSDTMSFHCSDDMFVFINGILAVDLGACIPRSRGREAQHLRRHLQADRRAHLQPRLLPDEPRHDELRVRPQDDRDLADEPDGGVFSDGGGAPVAGGMPRPGMLALLGVGLAGLGTCGRRPRRAEAASA